MKMLVCEVCENRGLTKNGDLYVCPSCGAGFPAADVKKLLVEVADEPAAAPAPVEERKEGKYLLLARQAAEVCNYEEAAKYYSMAKEEKSDNWECVFYTNYYKAKNTNVANIVSAAMLVTNVIPLTVNLLKPLTAAERNAAADKLANDTLALHRMFFSAAIDYQQTGHLRERVCASLEMLLTLMERLDTVFPDDREIGKVRFRLCDKLLENQDYLKIEIQDRCRDVMAEYADCDRERAELWVHPEIYRLRREIEKAMKPKPKNKVLAIIFSVFTAYGALGAIVNLANGNEISVVMISLVWAVVFFSVAFLCWRPKTVSEEEQKKTAAIIAEAEEKIRKWEKLMGE